MAKLSRFQKWMTEFKRAPFQKANNNKKNLLTQQNGRKIDENHMKQPKRDWGQCDNYGHFYEEAKALIYGQENQFSTYIFGKILLFCHLFI